MADGRSPGRLRLAPFLAEDRPRRLVETLPVADERLSQNAFPHGANLSERAVAPAVQHRRARLEPVAADRVERELHDELRAVDENAGAPELRRDGKAPLRAAEVGFERTDLEQTDCDIGPARNDREADVLSGRALLVRPRDAPLE